MCESAIWDMHTRRVLCTVVVNGTKPLVTRAFPSFSVSVLWMMLGLFPNQAEIEELYAAPDQEVHTCVLLSPYSCWWIIDNQEHPEISAHVSFENTLNVCILFMQLPLG